jgi:hypothetical protein
MECGADGEAIIITNNTTADDPTFDELAAFILADVTDSREYIKGTFVCADFAEAVHNNAEAAGIRAAWVSLSFDGTEEGHALNAFETTDKGLIFIDCTNSSGADNGDNSARNRDAVAYVETGKKYGVILIERVLALEYEYFPFDYAFYTDCENAWKEFKIKLAAFNAEVERYNKETGSRVFIIGTPDAERMLAWKETLLMAEIELKALKAQAGDRWIESEYSSFLVKSVNIHW